MNVNHQVGLLFEYVYISLLPFLLTFFFVQPTNQNNNNNGSSINHNTTLVRQPSPATHFDTSTVDRSTKNGVVENYNGQMQNEHAWAIERKRAGAK